MNKQIDLLRKEASWTKRTDTPLTPMKRPASKPLTMKRRKQQYPNFNQSDSTDGLIEGQRSGERKRTTCHPSRWRLLSACWLLNVPATCQCISGTVLRSGTIRVQTDKHWHCFEGNLGETAERRGGARMGLSKRCDGTLSRN